MAIFLTAPEPFFSVLILAYGPKSYLLSMTIDHLASQTFTDFEVLIADAREEKKEIDFPKAVIVPFSPEASTLEMVHHLLNRANGRYIHLLRAGEYYLATHCLQWLADGAAAEGYPDLFCTGFIQRHSLSPTEYLYYAPTKENLMKGKFPSQPALFWKRKSLIEMAPSSGHVDWLCRFVEKGKHCAFINRIFVDYLYQAPTKRTAIGNVKDSGRVLLRYYGPRPTLALWFSRIALHFIRWWCARVKKMFHPTS